MQVVTVAHENKTTTTRLTSDQVHHLDAPLDGLNYEARIYDLRALTNYTFQVHVSRFQHEQPTPAPPIPSERRQRTQAAARQLDLVTGGGGNDIADARRIETKPFGAEATKCLADVSEVLVNTGRYFGGRISVEDSLDPRCNLIGNKSSEQSSYLFRIDHEICASKLVDGNRIETMVLVHENKDILTHNTARFLVLCNFLQTKSFTLRASVSLPKVNGLGGVSRPAVITSLPGRPGGLSNQLPHLATPTSDGQPTSLVMLGSMPGIYRARAAGSVNSTSDDASPTSSSSHHHRQQQQHDVELETNTIESKSAERKKQLRAALEKDGLVSVMMAAESAPNAQRQAKELDDIAAPLKPLRRHSNNADKARSLANIEQPQPVQVQSKVLFVERGDNGGFARSARQYQILDVGKSRNHPMQVHSASRKIDSATSQLILAPSPTDSVAASEESRISLQSINGDESAADLRATPIIITNNHRVAGDYLPVSLAAARAAAARSAVVPTSDDNYSIKYSAAKVDEFPLSSAGELPLIELASQLGRTRSGRMQRMKTEATSTTGSHQPPFASTTSLLMAGRAADSLANNEFDVTSPRASSPSQSDVWAVNRMGELMAEGGDLASAETSNETQVGDQPAGQLTTGSNKPSLAANITSALLKWSLKTLGSLARASLETLAESTFNNGSLSVVANNETHDDSPSELLAAPVTDRVQITTKRPLLVTSIVQQPNTKSSTTTNAPGQQRPTETDLDGFIISSLKQRHSPTRSVNYSKSLDLSRIQLGGDQLRHKTSIEKNGTKTSEYQHSNNESSKVTIASTTTTTTTTTKPHRHHHHHHPHQSLNQQRSNESANGNRLQADDLTFYSSWLFYAMALTVATVTGIVLILYLLDSTPLSSGSSGPGAMLGGQINCSAVRPALGFDHTPGDDSTSCQGGSVGTAISNTSLGHGVDHESVRSSYQEYDYNKFKNYPTMSTSRLHLLQPSNRQPDSCSSGSSVIDENNNSKTSGCRSSGSGSTDGTALMLAEENDCKNNEIFYTEHVLINTNSKFGNESYA